MYLAGSYSRSWRNQANPLTHCGFCIVPLIDETIACNVQIHWQSSVELQPFNWFVVACFGTVSCFALVNVMFSKTWTQAFPLSNNSPVGNRVSYFELSGCEDADECAGEGTGHQCAAEATYVEMLDCKQKTLQGQHNAPCLKRQTLCYRCNNTVGSYTCTCPSGYDGDGTIGGSGCTFVAVSGVTVVPSPLLVHVSHFEVPTKIYLCVCLLRSCATQIRAIASQYALTPLQHHTTTALAMMVSLAMVSGVCFRWSGWLQLEAVESCSEWLLAQLL